MVVISKCLKAMLPQLMHPPSFCGCVSLHNVQVLLFPGFLIANVDDSECVFPVRLFQTLYMR